MQRTQPLSIVNTFQKILADSNRKPNKIWVDKGNEFYSSTFNKSLKDIETILKRIRYITKESLLLLKDLLDYMIT